MQRICYLAGETANVTIDQFFTSLQVNEFMYTCILHSELSFTCILNRATLKQWAWLREEWSKKDT